MGNCNSQDLGRALEDKCSSGGSRRARRRNSSSSSSSSASSSSASANKRSTTTTAKVNAKGKSRTVVPTSNSIQGRAGKLTTSATEEYDQSKVIVIDDATEAPSEEANPGGKRNPIEGLAGELVGANNETISRATTMNEAEHKSDSDGQQGDAQKAEGKPSHEQDSKRAEAGDAANKLEKLKGELTSTFALHPNSDTWLAYLHLSFL